MVLVFKIHHIELFSLGQECSAPVLKEGFSWGHSLIEVMGGQTQGLLPRALQELKLLPRGTQPLISDALGQTCELILRL